MGADGPLPSRCAVQSSINRRASGSKRGRGQVQRESLNMADKKRNAGILLVTRLLFLLLDKMSVVMSHTVTCHKEAADWQMSADEPENRSVISQFCPTTVLSAVSPITGLCWPHCRWSVISTLLEVTRLQQQQSLVFLIMFKGLLVDSHWSCQQLRGVACAHSQMHQPSIINNHRELKRKSSLKTFIFTFV